MECAFCGMPLKGDEPDLVWSSGADRDPFCNVECELAQAVDRSIAHAAQSAGRRRDHSLCGVSPCSHCR